MDALSYYINKLSKLNGYTIECPVIDESEEFFGLVLVNAQRDVKTLWILRDDEGNGPGSFEIQEE